MKTIPFKIPADYAVIITHPDFNRNGLIAIVAPSQSHGLHFLGRAVTKGRVLKLIGSPLRIQSGNVWNELCALSADWLYGSTTFFDIEQFWSVPAKSPECFLDSILRNARFTLDHGIFDCQDEIT